MRWLLAVVALLVIGCGPATAPAKPALGPDAVADALKRSGLPVSDVRVLTAETDLNKLLGRPGQYTGKISWHDTRTEPGEARDATIELFPDQTTMETRRKYLEPFTTLALTAQYMYVNAARRAILRLPHELTPDQAAQYEDWLARL